jgi:hypothetical protein
MTEGVIRHEIHPSRKQTFKSDFLCTLKPKSDLCFIHLSLLENGLAAFGPVEGRVLLVAADGRAVQGLLGLEASAKVDALLQRVEPVLVALAAWGQC